MTAVESELAAVVTTLTPALKRERRTPKAFSRSQRRDLRDAFRWNADRNIVGFGYGYKRTGPRRRADRSQLCLMVFVVKKLATSRVPSGLLVPKRFAASTVERELPTDVYEVGEVPRLQAATDLRPGSSAAHFSMRQGTLTAIVRSQLQPATFLLGCCHAFAPTHRLNAQIEAPPDPSSLTFTNRVADVAAFEPLRPGGMLANRIDAAIGAPIAGGPLLTNAIVGMGPVTSASRLRAGEFLNHGVRRVFGRGAVTPRVTGDIIADRAATLLVDPFNRTFLFQDVVAYGATPLTQAGDSGMPLVIPTPTGLQLVGMHIGLGTIAGTQRGAAFFVPIAPVLDRFRVALAV